MSQTKLVNSDKIILMEAISINFRMSCLARIGLSCVWYYGNFVRKISFIVDRCTWLHSHIEIKLIAILNTVHEILQVMLITVIECKLMLKL